MSHLAEAITIRNITFKNRIIKAAMSEALANDAGQPSQLHFKFMKPGPKVAWAVPLQEM